MNALLRELRNEVMLNMRGPAHRFFTPTAAFFAALEEFKHLTLVDAGTGMGQLPDEARKRGFKMVGLDLLRRPGQSESVLFMEAESFPYSDSKWLMMCRPDHSGWVYDTLETALKRGAGVFYVGLEDNLLTDLGDYIGRSTKAWQKVGKDGECMFLFMPSALLPEDDSF